MDILFPTVTSVTASPQKVAAHFGDFPKGSVISYQQRKSSDYLINLLDENDFPRLPVKNVMKLNVPFVLQEQQIKQLQMLHITDIECVEIAENTRSQYKDPRWHKLRNEGITAGEIAKRCADGKKLAKILMAARNYQSAAMKRGLESEATAAQAYSQKTENDFNLYPCGVIVNWLAATPDRKMYCPSRDPPMDY